MKKKLLFHTIVYDSVLLSKELKKYIMFTHNEIEGESDRNKSEQIIIKWLFSKPAFREIFYPLLNISYDSNVRFDVKSPIIPNPNRTPGDIDIMLFNWGQIEKTVAIEVKKVKYICEPDGRERLNKVHDIKDGVSQTKGLLEMGFYQTYLAVIIVSDGRNIILNNYVFRGISRECFQEVYDFQDRENLNDRVGLIFIEIVQPTSVSVNNTGVIGVCIDREAIKQEQSKDLTERLKKYL